MKKFLLLLVMLMPLGFISCGDGQSNDEPEPINPTPVTAKDPEGTVVLNVMLGYSIMDGLSLTKNYNLEVSYYYSKIYQIGEVANIASINVQPGTITDSQWKKSVGAFVHFGFEISRTLPCCFLSLTSLSYFSKFHYSHTNTIPLKLFEHQI